ncbi:MAG: trigger factor, partial [Chlamydiota bacterium]
MTNEPQQFSSELVQFTVTTKPASVVEFDVKASADLVKSTYGAAVKAVAKHVVIPGFRKGRAPEALVAKNYASDVNKQWQEEIALKAIVECQKLSNITPLQRDSKVSFNVKNFSKENGAELTLAFEVEPEIPTTDPQLFHPQEIKRPAVDEKKVEETIRQIRFFYAEWTTIADRPVQEGDLVILDVDIIETEPAQPLFSGTRFEVTDNSMAKWMKDLCLGLTTGATAEGLSVPDDTLSPEEKEQFQPKKVRLTVRTIEQATLPPLDDTFAKNLGVATVADLHEQIEKLLNFKADSHVQEQLRTQASEFLLAQYPFALPQSLIEKETHFRVKHLMNDQEFQKYWQQMSDAERQNAIQTIYQQSEKAVRMFYLCRKVLSDANITITPKDLPP